MNFILNECTFFRYFLPITIEGNKRGIKSNYFIYNSNKYNCPSKHTSQIKHLALTYNFSIHDASKAPKFPGLTFLIEGIGTQYLNDNHKKVSISYMTDFTISYNQYVNRVDHIILPSKFLQEFYKIPNSSKNLYLGSPKYDIDLNRAETLKRYNLEDKKYALIVYPRSRDINKINISKLYSILKELGYTIIVKSRGKDPINHKGDHNLYDSKWFPHDSLELISISDLVINFSSTVIKELVLLKTPCINFNIKPFGLLLPFLYDQNSVELNPNNFTKSDITEAINGLKSYDDYELLIEKYLFKPGETSKQILDKLV
jgi:hypothetical protein